MTERRPDREQPGADVDHPAHARIPALARYASASRIRPLQVLAAWLGAFAGIAAVVLLVELFPGLQLLVIGSFGASAVLLFAAVVGVACLRFLPDLLFIQASAAVATAIALMMLTRTVHPPGGATALIAVIGPEALRAMGWAYVFPVLVGSLALLLVALVSNNLLEAGSYPDRWH